MRFLSKLALIVGTLAGAILYPTGSIHAADAAPPSGTADFAVTYHTARIDGVRIFYREAGDVKNPTLILLHGFPSSSHMFRDFIPQLAGHYHVIAPDYPGFGNSEAPSPERFAYTFDHLASIVDALLVQLKIERYALYVQDYGAPVGFRILTAHPDRVTAIVSQNGNAYDEGLTPFWAKYFYAYWKSHDRALEPALEGLLTRETTTFQYTQGVNNPARISPDAIDSDQRILDRPGEHAIQLALSYDYRTNPPLYAAWHAALKNNRVPVLAVWGANDPIFGKEGALAFRRDDPKAVVKFYATGHFALEEFARSIAQDVRAFLDANLHRTSSAVVR